MTVASATIEHWQTQRVERSRRELRSRVAFSAVGHLLFAALLFVMPSPAALPLPAVVTIDLVAAPPVPAAVRRPAPAVKAPAPPPPPEPAPAAVPPPPVPQKKVLPREAEAPRSKPKPAPPRPARRQEMKYDDALAALRDELGESTPTAAEDVLDAKPAQAAASGPGRVDPEVARWQAAVNAALGRTWVATAEMRTSGLTTLLTITVTADGHLLGSVVKRSSGDPYFDDSAQNALRMVGRLPPPPSPGDWPFLFDPME